MKKSKRDVAKDVGSATVRGEQQDTMLRNIRCSEDGTDRSRQRDSSVTGVLVPGGCEFESSNCCRCVCHCSASQDGSVENNVSALPVSPQKTHNIFTTLRKKFSQIMKRDANDVRSFDSFKTLPRSKSSDRASTGHTVSRSRTLPRKAVMAHGSSSPISPVRPSDEVAESFSLSRGRSFHRQSQKTCDAELTLSLSAAVSPARLQHRSACCSQRDNWPSVTLSDDNCVISRTANVAVTEKQVAVTVVPVQDTGYGHTSAPISADVNEDELAGASATAGSAPFYDQVKETMAAVNPGWSLTRELHKLPKYGWYWGPIARAEAEERLAGQPDGAFLLRDSSDDRYLLSLSFRSDGRTLHTRIEHCNGLFSFYAQPESEGYKSVVELIEKSMSESQTGVFCYSRARTPGSPSFPVRLARPVSRFTQVRSLQYLCRFVIRQHTRIDYIQMLPLPTSIKGWLEETQY